MRSRIIVSQMRSRGAPLVIFLVCLLATLACPAMANPVVIQDPSFDNRSLSSGSLSTALTPWQETGGTANGGGYVQRTTGFAADGQNHLGMNLNHNVWQDLGVIYQANTRYTLTVAVGNRSGFTHSANQSRYLLASSDGTIFATGTLNASTLPLGTFADAPALIFETGTRSSANGKTIRVLLEARGSGRSHFDKIRLTAVPTVPPLASTQAASEVTDTGAILNGTVNGRGFGAMISFEYGPTTGYGSSIPGNPVTVSGIADTAVSAALNGLPTGATLHYRVVASNEAGTTHGQDQTFTTESPAYLSGLSVSEAVLTPSFKPTVTSYAVQVSGATTAIRLTPETQDAGATIRVQGVELASGTASAPIPLAVGNSVINVDVTAAGASFVKNYQVTVTRPPAEFAFVSMDAPAIEAAAFDATGLSLDVSLGFAPQPGTCLTVLNHTGTGFIGGKFANLAQGQIVILAHNGISYPFVANYHGGTGNDLTLEWATTRPAAWGGNQNGQLGTGDTVDRSLVPVAVDRSGILNGKTILATTAGDGFNVALCADGTLASWGRNYFYGQLGNNRTTSSLIPVGVDVSGVLAGKTPIAVAAGVEHTLVLCADGTLATWGRNNFGVLGDGSSVSHSAVPVAVDRSGVLAGKQVVAIAAGSEHNLVLCSDGTLAAWGGNSTAQLGNGGLITSPVPVLVNFPDYLRNKTAVRIAAGEKFSLVLYNDGTLAAWGGNTYGQLGIGTLSDHSGVVQTGTAGILAGKKIIDIAAGAAHALALCSDGTLAAWGLNHSGQLGNNGTANSPVPVSVDRSGVLAGKTVTSLATRSFHSLVRCADGTMAAWGWNFYGGLGNNAETHSLVPVQVVPSIFNPGERFGTVSTAGANHSVAVIASPAPPVAETLAATSVGDTRSTLNARVHPNATASTVSFEYGLTADYGATLSATPAQFGGTATATTRAVAEGLLSNTTYHFRAVATYANGTWRGEDMTFTTSGFSTLADLAVSPGTLVPGFTPLTRSYAVTVPNATGRITFTPVAAFPGGSITVNGKSVSSGAAGDPVELAEGDNVVSIVVTAADGINAQNYKVTVTRVPQRLSFDSPGEVPLRVASLIASGGTISFDLAFHPPVGTNLTAIRQAGLVPIDGFFDNLAHGQMVVLPFGGIGYSFVADYFGGDGNDLVLRWANTRLFGWGSNHQYQLGFVSTSSSIVSLPTPSDPSAFLSNKTINAVAAGNGFALILRSDGVVAALGTNSSGQLGNPAVTSRTAVPVEVNRSGVLAGRTVVAVAAGVNHSLALCSDGTLAAWGNGANGKLGNNGTTQSSVPVEVIRGAALSGRRVVAITAGSNHNLALCQDGIVFAWGANAGGQLGNGTQTDALVPVAVDMSGVLSGKRVVAIAAGNSHSLVLCDDGTLSTWGDNSQGQLGNNVSSNSTVPVAVHRGGLLAGKTVTKIMAGASHNFALCSDGTLAAWGSGSSGILGDGIGTSGHTSQVPVAVLPAGALAGKEIIAAAGGNGFSLALCSDHSAAGWGTGSYGQIGSGSANFSNVVPVAVNQANFAPGERLVHLTSGPSSYSSFAIVGSPPPPAPITLAVTGLRDKSATLNGSIMANGVESAVRFELGSTPEYGTTFTASPALVSGVESTPVSFTLDGLTPGKTYHYRVVATGPGGTSFGDNIEFTTTTLATLAGLSLGEATISPEFDPVRTRYTTTVPFAVAGVSVTPTAKHPAATLQVNGTAAASGEPARLLPLVVGANSVTVEVISGDGQNTMTYEIAVTRMAERYEWKAAGDVPMEGEGFLATGDLPPLALGFAPEVGTSLTLVKNTGDHPIAGTFGNLAQGQMLSFEFDGIHYPFIVNYAGGSGNDLVLEWGNNRLMNWGLNINVPAWDGATTYAVVPTPVSAAGALAGKTVRDVACGSGHSLALFWDGTMAAWGGNSEGQLGSGGSNNGLTPTTVVTSGALEGKSVIQIAAGEYHNLALCSDGSLVAWGYNYQGQLGNNSSAPSSTPVAVDQTGALAGKRIVAIGAGKGFSVALCSDGTVAAWGWLYGEELSPQLFRMPVLMDRFDGRRVVKLSAGFQNFLALCDDGSLVCWGSNAAGQFGNGTKVSYGPRDSGKVNMAGVLAGKTVTEMAVGSGSMLVLSSDGTMVSWGSNYYGQLGIGNKTDSLQPVAVNRSGVLAGKTVVRVFSGQSQQYALCGDGTLAAWGYNYYGGLGNDTVADSMLPVEVIRRNFVPGERFVTTRKAATAYNHVLALTALPPAPGAATMAVTDVTDISVALHAQVRPNGLTTGVWFEYGLNPAYGTKVAAVPATVDGGGVKSVALPLANLLPGTTYHYRVLASSSGGTVAGADAVFTTTTLATLADLTVSEGKLSPAFRDTEYNYSITVPAETSNLLVTARPAESGATVKIGGMPGGSVTVALATGVNTVPLVVTGPDGNAGMPYSLTITRLPATLVFASHDGDALTAPAFDPAGQNLGIELGFQPQIGQPITVLRQAGIGLMRGRFQNLPQGTAMDLEFAGRVYAYVVNYYGGSGNDLVLEWANTRLASWGGNNEGQLGDRTTTSRNAPVWVNPPGILERRTVIQAASGAYHSIALCADGALAAWGSNSNGRLGIGSNDPRATEVSAVDVSGALAGKTVVALAAGNTESLLLCSDGSLVGLGVDSSKSPVALADLGDLEGREVVAIAAGRYHFLVLCSDGRIAAWGANTHGQLGNGATGTGSNVPTLVGKDSVLEGKRVIAIAAADSHNLVLTEDGGMFAWGSNASGQLGDGTKTNRNLPVAVNRVGALAGRVPVAIATASSHSAVVCGDGSMVTWGSNSSGQLGDGTTTERLVPVEVTKTGILAGKAPAMVACGATHTHALMTDGTLAGWGANSAFGSFGLSGMLGNGSTSFSSVPVAVIDTLLPAGGRFSRVWSGSVAHHSFAPIAFAPMARLTTGAADEVLDQAATLTGTVLPNGSGTTVWFEYGVTETYGKTIAAAPATLAGGLAQTAVAANVTGLLTGTTYHFRVVAENDGGVSYGENQTFTTTTEAALAGLTTDSGALFPGFDMKTGRYLITLPHATTSLSLTPLALSAGATLRVNGQATASGTPTPAIPLAVGNRTINIEVRSADGKNIQSYQVVVTRLPETFTFSSGSSIPVTAEGFAAAGMAPEIRLEFAPTAGTRLTLVRSTGQEVIGGEFANLVHGQRLDLVHEGVIYPFVVNYLGGDGNDLVLEWANRRLIAWGNNGNGQLGNGNHETFTLPAEIPSGGGLVGKTLLAVVSGASHSIAICSDGSLAAWGSNNYGQLGDGTLVSRNVPVTVDASGALAGKRVIQLAAGSGHSLALCSDGTLVAWGNNAVGQLGAAPATLTQSSVPRIIDPMGALAGRTVVGIGIGEAASYAILSDGTVAAWGGNSSGQLGNDSTFSTPIPVSVHRSGVLAGKSVVAVDGGVNHAVALCSDGTLVTWGDNSQRQLGTTGNTTRRIPYAVDASGVLAGKTPITVVAGSYHNLALCSDGSLISWGRDSASELGNGTPTNSPVPVAVLMDGVLSGKNPVAVTAGSIHSLVLCDDGFVASWGTTSGGLGNGVDNASNVPVEVNRSLLRPGETILALEAGSGYSQMIVASPPRSAAATLAAAAIHDTGATLNAEIAANGSETRVSFDFGLAGGLTKRFVASPSTSSGIATTAHSALVGNLLGNTIYQFRAVSEGPGGTVYGETRTFTTTSKALLTDLQAGDRPLTPGFSQNHGSNAVTVGNPVENISITPVAANPAASIRVNGNPVSSGIASSSIDLPVGDTLVTIVVDANDGINQRTYQVTVSRLPGALVLGSPQAVPLIVESLAPAGLSIPITLGYAPVPGARILLASVTSGAPIDGTFDNLPQGGTVFLEYGGISYPFVAHYFGGDGNDLVLVPLHGRLLGWGNNSQRQLSPSTENQIPTPRDLDPDGLFAGKALIDLATGGRQSLALFADGSLYQWRSHTENPERIDGQGALSGRRVIAIASGDQHSLALCDDGTLAAWGQNGDGQLGTNTNQNSVIPLAVDQSGIMADKRVTGIAAGFRHCLALCSDGSVFSWGANNSGQLGNSTTTMSRLPVAVDLSAITGGRRIVFLRSGVNSNLALLDNGELAGWGDNQFGQVGDGTTTNQTRPVAVGRPGLLADKTIVSIAAGDFFCAALCSDDTLATWGYNSGGRLGDGTQTHRPSPVAVQGNGVLAGKSVVAIALGNEHSLAAAADGTLVAWGGNSSRALGNNTSGFASLPTLVERGEISPSESISRIVTGSTATSNLLHVAGPPGPVGQTLAATGINDSFATLHGSVITNGNDTRVTFEYGLTPEYGFSVVLENDLSSTRTGNIEVDATINGLLSGTTYHFRLRVQGPFGTTLGENRSFTTTTRAALASLEMSAGSIIPAFQGALVDYRGTAPFAADSIRLSPVAATGAPTITINGTVVSSGTQSPQIPLQIGLNTIKIHVDAGDGLNGKTYTLTLRRLPQSLVANDPESAPFTVEELTAAGDLSPVSLEFPVSTGASLTLIEVSGDKLIEGEFANLPHGGSISLDHGDITYQLVADYAGGDGNDLVLHWANRRLLAWGSNHRSQLGNGTGARSLVPTPVDASGPLAGLTVTRISAGMTGFAEYGFSHAITADGRVASWGYGDLGTLGTGEFKDSPLPVWADHDGVLAGRKVIDIGTGAGHTVALCLDGGMVAWGYNSYSSQLGDGTSANRAAPVNVRMTGTLAGKRVRAIAVGNFHNLALCEDGTLIGWGDNNVGQLGTGDTVRRLTPHIIPVTGALEGKRIVRIAAGSAFSLALCDDGTLAAWGYNQQGQLGNGGTAQSIIPVAVDLSGALAGKNVVEIACGYNHALVRCDDGSLVAWGNNGWGQLGIGQPNASGFGSVNPLPVVVDLTGISGEKTVTAVSGSRLGTLARLADGRFFAWGINDNGQLGDGTQMDRSLPVEISRESFHPGETGLALGSSSSAGSHALGLTALALPDAIALAADDITGVSATLQGTVHANGNEVAVAFEYGLDESFGSRVDAISGGNNGAGVFAPLSGLMPGTTYHFRVVVESRGGIVRSPATFFTTLSDNAKLAALGTSAGAPAPVFAKETFSYFISVAHAAERISITPITDHPGARVRIGGQDVVSGTVSQELPLAVGNNTLTVFVTAEDGIATLTYSLLITRLPAVLSLDPSGVPPITADGFFANDLQAILRLGFHPSPGSTLRVVNHTGLAFIHGRFSNLSHGQRVWLTHDGVSYAFVANYHGGTGNDLVLQWAGTRVAAWGLNNYGQLGDGGNTQRLSPVEVDGSGVLADKTILAVATGYLHSVALSSDGTLASWGYNVQGQLGDNGSANQSRPVAVDTTGVLSGKVVVAISSGSYHNLALCSDGTIAAWGFNNHGQLGDGTKTTARTPVLVKVDGVLSGKQVVAVAAGAYQSYALCSDGTLAAWGYNDEGELGNGSNTTSQVPVAVDASGVLAGRKVAAIAAGQYHALALCTDGSVVSWGYNPRGQLGNSSTADSNTPVAIGSFGALAGKSVKSIDAGASHSLALCTDGTLAAWGFNSQNQLGVAGMNQSTRPLAVVPPANMTGRVMTSIMAGAHHNLLHFTDGGMAGWGANSNGQLGSNSTQASAAMLDVETGTLAHGGFIMFAASGCASSHNLAVFAVPVDPPAAGLEAWRLENFGDLGTGNALAGDCEDCDGDGIPNLVEYAFGLDPRDNGDRELPQPQRIGDRFELRFSRSPAAHDIQYGAEWSPNLQPGSWRDVFDSGNGEQRVFSMPIDSPRGGFMRLRVRSVTPN